MGEEEKQNEAEEGKMQIEEEEENEEIMTKKTYSSINVPQPSGKMDVINKEDSEEEEEGEREEIYIPPASSNRGGSRKRRIPSLPSVERKSKRQKIRKRNEDDYVGVYDTDKPGIYRVQRMIAGKAYNGGTYDSKIGAARASDALVLKQYT